MLTVKSTQNRRRNNLTQGKDEQQMKQVRQTLLLTVLALLIAAPALAGNYMYLVGEEMPVEMLPLRDGGAAIVLLSRDGQSVTLFTLSPSGQSYRSTAPACIAGSKPNGVPGRAIVRGVGKYIHVTLDCPDMLATVYHRWTLPDGLLVEGDWQQGYVYLPLIGGEQ